MSEMTGRERLHAAMRGDPVDHVPFALNAWHWYYAHRYMNIMPDEFADCETAIAFHKKVGADILTRWDAQVKGRGCPGDYVRFPSCKFHREEFGEPLRQPTVTAYNPYTRLGKVRSTLETPEGTLTQVWRFTEETNADFEEEYWVKDWDRDFAAMKFFFEDRTYNFDMAEYERDVSEIGQTGVVMMEIPENPVKTLHWLMGPEKASLALVDFPTELKELFEIHTVKTLAFIDGICERTTNDDCPLLMSNDNLDAMLFPPYFFDQFLYDHYNRVGERIHEHGRLFSVHSCGNNWEIRDCIRDSGIDMMEGLTPPELGNFPLPLAREEMGDDFIVEGGMFCVHQELTNGAAEAIDAYTEDLFEKMKDTRRFIYSSSCQTSPRTPIDNIHYFRDACLKYGQRGH